MISKIYFLFFFSIHQCCAGLMSEQLQRYFNNFGGASNSTGASTYKNQSAGYYNGGSFFGRMPVQSAQLSHIQMPGFRAGCGGIDAWFGGLSHISSDQLINVLRQIMGNMGSYAFMLALESLSPEIYNVMNELQAIAQKINSLNINTCEAAATALGGLLPQSDATSKHLCQSMSSMQSSFGGLSDWTAARHKCGAGGKREEILDSNIAGVQDTFKDQFNLVWQAIQKNSFLISDNRLSELFMTLAGTLIVRREGEGYKTIHLRSRAIDQEFIKSILHGGNIKIYHCGADEKCLDPTLGQDEMISSSTDSLVGRVNTVLNTIVDKIYKDEALTSEEQRFLTGTTLPVYKILNILTAYKKGHAPIEISNYAELIALDILNHFLLEVLDIVEESISHLRSAQVSDAAIRDYLLNLQSARKFIINERESAMAHMNATLSMIKSVQMVEKQLHVYLGTMSNMDESSW